VLPRLFRAVASSTELVLITAIAWCFLTSGIAGAFGLSREMGALIAGMVIAAFPYGVEVITRLSGIRDFFVTLFFVALGLKAPAPTRSLLLLAGLAALFVVASRLWRCCRSSARCGWTRGRRGWSRSTWVRSASSRW
jgi:Kef-type K+ transport system membrane component KefB